MPQRMLYSGSYDGLASQELQRDAMRDSRYFRALQLQQAVDAARQQQAQQQFANRFSVANLLNQQANQNRNFAYAQGQQGFENALNMQRLLVNDQNANRDFGLRERQVNAQMGQQDYNEATRAIESGLVNPENLGAMFPGLNPTQSSRLGGYFNALRAQEEADRQGIDDNVNTMNSMVRMREQQNAMSKLGKRPEDRWWWIDGPAQARWDAANQNITAGNVPPEAKLTPADFNALVEDMLKNRMMSSSVGVDPEGMRFTPKYPPSTYGNGMPQRPFSMTPAPTANRSLPSGVPAAPVPTAQQPGAPLTPAPQTPSVPQFNTEAEARAAGFKTGQSVKLFIPEYRRYIEVELD